MPEYDTAPIPVSSLSESPPRIRALAHDLLGFLRFLARRWSEDRCTQIAGSLTFVTLLALAPAFAIVVAMLSSSPIFENVMVRLKIFLLLNLVPEIAGKIITVYMTQFAEAAAKLTLVSLVILLASSLAVMLTVDRTLNRIWRVRRPRGLAASFGGYLLLFAAGPLLIGASVSLTTFLLGLAAGVENVPGEAHALLTRSVSIGVGTMIFFLIYRVVPARPVSWRHALLGGSIAALLFEAMKEGFAAYVRVAPTYDVVYGAFAAVPLVLLWIYLAWLVVLLGAEVTACAEYWTERPWVRPRLAALPMRDAMELVHQLMRAEGRPVAFEALRQELRADSHALEDALLGLAERGIVRRLGPSEYVLARGAESFTLADFYAALGRDSGR